jgi:NAD(P)H-dependent flavin oxidoreductase YrpB (nitropropane dioxygenase family)
MWTDTPVTRRLGIALPILQAPLGGGPGTPALTAAVGEAGGDHTTRGPRPRRYRADLVIAQGAEAGGCRGSFSPDTPAIGLVALASALADVLTSP